MNKYIKDEVYTWLNLYTEPGKQILQPENWDYENLVFISYAWEKESELIVNKLEAAFERNGIKLVRDKKDLSYKASIEAFEKRIGRGQCVVLIISDEYLRSVHCMYELVEIAKNQETHERIFPIVLSSARIYNSEDRLDYINFWDEKIFKLDQAIKNIEGQIVGIRGITSDLDKYAHIRENIDQLTDLLSDMNALTPDIHRSEDFSALINAVKLILTRNLDDQFEYQFDTNEISGIGQLTEDQLQRSISITSESLIQRLKSQIRLAQMEISQLDESSHAKSEMEGKHFKKIRETVDELEDFSQTLTKGLELAEISLECAFAYYKMGNIGDSDNFLRSSIPFYRQAIYLYENGNVHNMSIASWLLGNVFWRMGNRKKAYAQWQRSYNIFYNLISTDIDPNGYKKRSDKMREKIQLRITSGI